VESGLADLETTRLRLRPLGASDEDNLHRLYSDPEVVRYLGKGGVRTRAETVRALATAIEHWGQRGYGIWALTDRDSGQFVGRCGLRFLPEVGEVELLYTLLKEFWGRGLATEASRAVLDFGFGRAGLKRIIALADPENTASWRVMEKLGMRREKTAPYQELPAVWYALTREEYLTGRGDHA
jgi:RimJ/RimL family protein N-acetyltransferase